MPAFNVEAVDAIKAACEATLGETSDAFSRAFDQTIQVKIGEGGPLDVEADLAGLDQPGLAIVLNVEDQAAIIVISEASGILPLWYLEPDPTGESKLATLGQELGMTLLPDDLMAMEFKVANVEHLAEACKAGQFGESAGKLNLTLNVDGHDNQILMAWPIQNPDDVFQEAEPEPTEEPEESHDAPEPSPAVSPSIPQSQRISGFSELPAYSRSMLNIKVPMRVILASKKMHVHDIINLGEGTIIQFNKSCEDALDVEIGRQRIAEGEAVKIGDKFGVRITSIAMPEERYIALKARKRVR